MNIVSDKLRIEGERIEYRPGYRPEANDEVVEEIENINKALRRAGIEYQVRVNHES